MMGVSNKDQIQSLEEFKYILKDELKSVYTTVDALHKLECNGSDAED